MTEKTVINIDDVPLVDRGNGKQFAVKWGRVGPLVGLNGLGCGARRSSRQKGISLRPSSRQDGLFFIVSGEGEYRFGEKILTVRSDDILAAPVGTRAYVGLGRIALADYYDGEDD